MKNGATATTARGREADRFLPGQQALCGGNAVDFAQWSAMAQPPAPSWLVEQHFQAVCPVEPFWSVEASFGQPFAKCRLTKCLHRQHRDTRPCRCSSQQYNGGSTGAFAWRFWLQDACAHRLGMPVSQRLLSTLPRSPLPPDVASKRISEA